MTFRSKLSTLSVLLELRPRPRHFSYPFRFVRGLAPSPPFCGLTQLYVPKNFPYGPRQLPIRPQPAPVIGFTFPRTSERLDDQTDRVGGKIGQMGL